MTYLDPCLFFGSIKDLLMEKLSPRFNVFEASLYTFVECFTSKTLLKWFNVPLKKIIVTETDDKKSLENVFREYFGPFIIDPVLDPNRPSNDGITNSDRYIHWLQINTPNGFRVEDYEQFVWLCDEVKRKWDNRREQETQILLGVKVIINTMVYACRFCVLFKCLEEGNIIPMIELGIIMLFCAWILKFPNQSVQT